MTGVERREQLLDATKQIALADGFHAVSIDAVARGAGITRPIVYGHFSDLPGLLDPLGERGAGRALAQLEAALSEFDRGDLLGALAGYLEAVRADPPTWRLVLMPQEGAPRTLLEGIALGPEAIVARLALGVEAGEDPELTAHMLSAYADEAARLTLTDPD